MRILIYRKTLSDPNGLHTQFFCRNYIIIQSVNHINEYLALCDMIDRFAESYPEEKVLFIADRGYVSMNVFAHAIEKNAFFLAEI